MFNNPFDQLVFAEPPGDVDTCVLCSDLPNAEPYGLCPNCEYPEQHSGLHLEEHWFL